LLRLADSTAINNQQIGCIVYNISRHVLPNDFFNNNTLFRHSP
jgi:hypothetical protein